MPNRKWKWAGLACAVAGVLPMSFVAGCGDRGNQTTIGYGFDNVITTYNANTTAGAVSAASVAFPRVLTGAFYTGPQGQPVADTDYATVEQLPGDDERIHYQLNPKAVYSDGVPLACDDLVLEWAARSGRFQHPDGSPMFHAADTHGYADIDRVECQPGAREATVVFRSGAGYADWRTLFRAAEMVPAHVAAKAVGIADVVAPIQADDLAVVDRIADFWNTGWDMKPGELDASRFPSSGPYRIGSFGSDGDLVLVANDRWWGRKPVTGRIILWPKNVDLAAHVTRHDINVLDIGAGSIPGLSLSGFISANYPSRNTEQLMLAGGGIFAKAGARRTFARCVPRQALYDQLGHPGYSPHTGLGSGILNSRIVGQDAPFYSAAAAAGQQYTGGTASGQSALADATVRIGYPAPDARRSEEVASIASACRASGVNVIDAASPQFNPMQLRAGAYDAILVGTAGTPGTGGTTADADARAGFRVGNGVDFSGYNSQRYGNLVDRIAGDGSITDILHADVDAETLLWDDMPSIPLFDQPRTIAYTAGMTNVVSNPNWSATGWNMDRWTPQ